MNETKKANLFWVDLEMTGLDPAVDRICEVGVIATDYDFNEIATYQATVKVDPDFMRSRMTGEFWELHKESHDSLIAANESRDAKESADVERDLIEFVKRNFDLTQPIYLAGNSVHQDQKFIERAWVQLNGMFNYRQLDVSAWKIIFEHHGVKFTKPEAHRAMSDIEGSMDELKYYLAKVKFDD